MLMLQELSDLKGLTTAQVIGGVVIVIIGAITVMQIWGDGAFSEIIRALRGPKQIVSHNICPKCQKVQTQEIDPD
jgi:hypothetical protein